MPVFEVSYAGIALCVPTPEARDWIDTAISTADLRDVQAPARWPGKNLNGLAWNNPTTYPCPRLGQLFWPCGASRWAIGHFLADGGMVQKIKNKVIPSSDFGSGNLVLRCNDGDDDAASTGITAKMYCLPPRPLGGLILDTAATGAAADLYLLTLVDIRYYWQWVQVTWTGDDANAWTDLYSALATALGVTLTPGSIDTLYGEPEPDSALSVNEENAALVLDAVLANTGRVLAANYDGTFTIQKIVDARDAAKTERDKWKDKRHAGGPVLALNANTTDSWRKAILPTNVQVTFPQWVDSKGYFAPALQYRSWILDTYNGVYTSNVAMSSLGSYYPAQVGTSLNWKKTFRDTAKARYTADPPSGDPSNKTTLDDLAKQLAKDYADGLLARLDEVYPGILPWKCDGCNDLLFLYRIGACQTRIQGHPFNAGVSELQHGFGPLTTEPVGSEKRVRITNYFVQDTDPPHSLPLSPLCYYPGVIQKLTAAGWEDTTTNVWVVFWHAFAAVEPLPGGPYTVVICDGTDATTAGPEGFDYAPDDGVHPNAGESRPVYGSTQYAAGWEVVCAANGVPKLTLG